MSASIKEELSHIRNRLDQVESILREQQIRETNRLAVWPRSKITPLPPGGDKSGSTRLPIDSGRVFDIVERLKMYGSANSETRAIYGFPIVITPHFGDQRGPLLRYL
jgi:hypothetical protein